MTRGRPFEPGNKFGRGRPKGSPNKKTKQISLSDAQEIFEMIENRRRVLVAQDLEGRLSALENAGRPSQEGSPPS